MKRVNIWLLSIILLSISCQKNQSLNDDVSSTDLAAIEGMEKALEVAEQYNDSIFTCIDFNPNCEVEYLDNCDSLFHHYADDYEHHHNAYSHANNGDDHHHEYMNQNHHGNGMHGGQNNGHSMQSMNQMDSLLVHHQVYH